MGIEVAEEVAPAGDGPARVDAVRLVGVAEGRVQGHGGGHDAEQDEGPIGVALRLEVENARAWGHRDVRANALSSERDLLHAEAIGAQHSVGTLVDVAEMNRPKEARDDRTR